MFQLDNQFLEDVGLGSLPDDQKQAFLAHFRDQLQLRVGTRLSEGLTEEQLATFESIVSRDESAVETWLKVNVPNYSDDQIWQELKAGAPDEIPESEVKAEYASIKWLGLNRPDYREVVSQVMGELRQEIVDNRDAILAGEMSSDDDQPETGDQAA